MADENEVLLKLVLREDWDMPVSLPIPGEPKRGHFAGRESELAALKNELTRRKNGAILISGHRGAGKTSLVHRALNQACDYNAKILPILVNAGHIDSGTADCSINPKSLIESIVRRLYSTAHADPAGEKDDGCSATDDFSTTVKPNPPEKLPLELLESIDALYRKCVATEFKLTETFGAGRSNNRETTVQQSWGLNSDAEELLAYARVVGLSVATTLAVVPALTSSTARAIAAVCSAVLPVFGSFIWKRKHTRTTLESNEFSAASLYHFDNKLSNLEFDLEVIHRKARDAGWKLVYVIDELDKVDIDRVKLVIAQCKNLFTLSDAIFVFIGDERLYDLGTKQDSKAYARDKEYTYFNSRYYIGPPSSKELEQFIEDIQQDSPIGTPDNLSTLRHCLIFEARNDFFDLITAIRGRVNSFEEDAPTITIRLPGFDADDVQKSRLAVCIASLYEDKYMSTSATKWRNNIELLKAVYSHAELFIQPDLPEEVVVSDGKSPTEAMVRDFDRLLVKLGALNDMSGIRQRNNVEKKFYPVIGPLKAQPSRRLDMLTEFERYYEQDCADFIGLLVALVNVGLKRAGRSELDASNSLIDIDPVFAEMQTLGYDKNAFINSHSKRYLQFKHLQSPYPDKRERIEELRNEVANMRLAFRRQLPEFVSALFETAVARIPSDRSYSQHYDDLLGPESALLANSLRGKTLWVVRRNDATKRVAFVSDANEALTHLGDALMKSMEGCRVVLVQERTTDVTPAGVDLIESHNPKALFTSLSKVLDDLSRYYLTETTTGVSE